MAKTLDAGKRVGLFIHSDDETAPLVAGALWLDDTRGVMAEIPYISFGSDQFDTPARWFSERRPPANLFFRSEKLSLSLFDCAFSRSTVGGSLDIGGLRVGEAVLDERAVDIDKPLETAVLISKIDGLAEWSRLSSVKWDAEWLEDERGPRKRIHYTVERQDGLTWHQGEARMALTTHWGSRGEEGQAGVHLDDAVVLRSKFRTPRPIREHLEEHWKFRNFLAFSFGVGVFFRMHELRDKSFPFRTMDGRVHSADYHQVISSATIGESQRPIPSDRSLHSPILGAEDVSADVLSRWAKDYDAMKRVVLPTAGALRRTGHFAEDIVINASMSVEALRGVLPMTTGEDVTYSGRRKPTVATDFYRAIAYSGIDSSSVASSVADLAWALANTYNTVKHADRGDFPEPMHLFFAGRISTLIVRVSVLRNLAPSSKAIDRFVNSWSVREIFDHMRQSSIRVVSPGKFTSTPAEP